MSKKAKLINLSSRYFKYVWKVGNPWLMMQSFASCIKVQKSNYFTSGCFIINKMVTEHVVTKFMFKKKIL